MNIATILEMAAESFPDRVAVVSGDERLTYAQLLSVARSTAVFVQQSGVKNLVYLDINSAMAPVALFAAAFAGVPYVPINYRLGAPEIERLLERVAPALIVGGEAYLKNVLLADGSKAVERPSLLSVIAPCGDSSPETPYDAHAVAVQLFTSGTTGEPKAALLRHENLMSYILGTVEFACAEENEATLVTVPPYHIAGVSAVLSSTYALRCMVQLPNFDAAEWLSLVRARNVSNAFLVPTMLGRIVDHLEADNMGANIPSLRAIAYGGGKMPLATIARAMALFPDVDFTNAYGLTETSSTIAILDPEDHRAALATDDPDIRRRLSSVGRPMPAVEIQIRDDEGGVLGRGKTGHIFVRGDQVAGEYRGQGSMLDSEGWFSTRDRGWQDEEGYLYLEGRADDVIVRGGENISPGEVEDVLLEHPAVLDAAVVAIPDEQWGEDVGAAIVKHHGATVSAAELQEWVKARLRSSRVPRHVEFRSELPYNETGKVLRRVIRQEFADRIAKPRS